MHDVAYVLAEEERRIVKKNDAHRIDLKGQSLVQAFQNLCMQEQFSDRRIRVREDHISYEYPVHELVLIARSPVFRAMLSERWSNGQNVIELSDTDPVAFVNLLK